ncbi:MAG: hypothetical protein QM714_06715 [Nocardioides sp.]|uniref:hypothetical protein n=1 Tax=Nocardioides sp. TaxID=35761 RepID=UPI0039E3FF85
MTGSDTQTSTSTRSLGLACAASGVLAAPLAVLAGIRIGDVSDTQWSYPHPTGLFLAEALLLVVVHLLQAAGFIGALRLEAAGNSGVGRLALWAGVVGLLGLSVAELWSGLIGGKANDSSIATTVSTVFGITSMVFALGAIVGGIAVVRAGVWRGPWKWTILATGVAIIALVTPANISGSLPFRQIALLIWSVLFIPLGLDIARGLARQAER